MKNLHRIEIGVYVLKLNLLTVKTLINTTQSDVNVNLTSLCTNIDVIMEFNINNGGVIN